MPKQVWMWRNVRAFRSGLFLSPVETDLFFKATFGPMTHKINTHSSTQKRNIRPEKVVEVLVRYNRTVTLAEAELILEITYKFAKLS